MFELAIIKDEVIIQPSEFGDFNKTLESRLKQRYVNKILTNEGLCVVLRGIKILDKIVVQGEGSVQVKVEVQAVLFKPEVKELIVGKVILQNEFGIFASVGTVTVFIPAENLMKPSYFNIHDKKWLWRFKDYDLYYEDGGQIKMRVNEVNFSKEYQAKIKQMQFSGYDMMSDISNLEQQDQIQGHFIIAQCDEECLGMSSWW